jgi:TolB-like protein
MLPIIGAVAAVFVMGIIAYVFFGTQFTTNEIQNKLLGKRILIKELENLSSEDGGLNLSRGIQNQLISGLSPTVLLPIVPKEETDQINSKNIPIDDLENGYNVGFLIDGSTSVQGNKFRVNLELLDVGKKNVVWSFMKDFSTDDTFDAQDKIEFEVRKAIQEKFTMGKDFSDSFVKYFGTGELYRSSLKAWISFQKKDAGKVGANYSDAFKVIKDDNPDNSQAHLLYAISLYNEDGSADYYEKRKDLLRSVRIANKLDPNNPMVYPVKAFFEFRFDEETDLRSVIAFKGLDMEPENYLSLLWTGHAFWVPPNLFSKFDFEMLFNSEYFEKAIEIAPYGPPSTKVYLLAAYIEEKKMEEANLLVNDMLNDSDRNLNFWGTVSKAFLLNLEGKKDEARQFLKAFMGRSNLSTDDVFDNFFQFPFVTIHFGFFSNRFLPAIQETMGLSSDVLDSYLWNRDN